MSAVGYFVALEWVGKLFVSVVSQPFFFGSGEHRDAAERLRDHDFSREYLELCVDEVEVEVWPGLPNSRPVVIWRTSVPVQRADAQPHDTQFFKILRGDGFDALSLRRIHDVYAALQTALGAAGDATERPPAIVYASLLFGAGELCVLMPWVGGRDAAQGDLGADGVAVVPVARAIIWLARRGLLYIDLREPNVRILDRGGDASAGAGRPLVDVKLIDYDDCVLVDPPTSVEQLLELLATHHAVFAASADIAGARPAVIAALREQWG